jgi:hypothetical protein
VVDDPVGLVDRGQQRDQGTGALIGLRAGDEAGRQRSAYLLLVRAVGRGPSGAGEEAEHLALASLQQATLDESLGELLLRPLAEPVDEVLGAALLLRDHVVRRPQDRVLGHLLGDGADLGGAPDGGLRLDLDGAGHGQLDQEGAAEGGLRIGGPGELAAVVVEEQQEQVLRDQGHHVPTVNGRAFPAKLCGSGRSQPRCRP